MIRRAAIAATMLIMLSTAGVAGASTPTVEIVNFAFSPSSVKIAVGSGVQWHNGTLNTNHTTTSDVPTLWNLAVNHGMTTALVPFNSSGTYLYHCTIHANMHGKVLVKMAAAPTTGPLGTLFEIRWAINNASPGWVFDVQKRKHGGTFKNWQTGVTQAHASFNAPKKGTFEFRSRLRKVGGASTGYSPVLSVKVLAPGS